MYHRVLYHKWMCFPYTIWHKWMLLNIIVTRNTFAGIPGRFGRYSQVDGLILCNSNNKFNCLERNHSETVNLSGWKLMYRIILSIQTLLRTRTYGLVNTTDTFLALQWVNKVLTLPLSWHFTTWDDTSKQYNFKQQVCVYPHISTTRTKEQFCFGDLSKQHLSITTKWL